MRLTTEEWRALIDPPAHVVTVLDSTVVRDETQRPVQFVLVVEVRHNESRDTWRQAFVLPFAQLEELVLSAHGAAPELSGP